MSETSRRKDSSYGRCHQYQRPGNERRAIAGRLRRPALQVPRRLSSGSRIVSPEDDAAGLAQSIKFDAQIHRNAAANSNVQNATSYSQTQDGFLQKVQKSLDRMSELSLLAQDATKTNSDLSNYQSEFAQLQNYISDITGKQFNGVSLFATTGIGITIDSDALTLAINAADLSGATSTGNGLNMTLCGSPAPVWGDDRR